MGYSKEILSDIMRYLDYPIPEALENIHDRMSKVLTAIETKKPSAIRRALSRPRVQALIGCVLGWIAAYSVGLYMSVPSEALYAVSFGFAGTILIAYVESRRR